jgi:hypothetical protein
MQVITSSVPTKDGCRLHNRLKAFIVVKGVSCILEHTFRDREGKPISLTDEITSISSSDSLSLSSPQPPELQVKIRIQEYLGYDFSIEAKLIETTGTIIDPEKGKCQFALTPEIPIEPGIYRLTWGIEKEPYGIIYSNDTVLSVERSLWGDPDSINNLGPPTIQEIRMWMMDADYLENPLIDELEFGDEQILKAIAEPIREWNETLPPLKQKYTTRNFPYRGAWATGILGYLHEMGAMHYRRNYLQTSGGGVAVADKAKAQEYLQYAQLLKQQYSRWVRAKKYSLNQQKFWGIIPTQYIFTRRRGW